MLNLPRRHPEPPLPVPRGPAGDNGSLACYGIVVATASLLLFSVLATTVSVAKACTLAGAIAVAFGATACVFRRCADRDGAASAATLPTTTVTPIPARAACRRGLVDAAIEALPSFAYARPAGKCRGAEGGSKSGMRALCAVCLEDVEAGEMVRRLPACGHLFHVECIDMWLHSHATCPLCRSDVAPPKGDAKIAAAADPPDDTLPPV